MNYVHISTSALFRNGTMCQKLKDSLKFFSMLGIIHSLLSFFHLKSRYKFFAVRFHLIPMFLVTEEGSISKFDNVSEMWNNLWRMRLPRETVPDKQKYIHTFIYTYIYVCMYVYRAAVTGCPRGGKVCIMYRNNIGWVGITVIHEKNLL